MEQLPETIDFPEWAQWLAQDGDGTWWIYEVEPLQYHCGWYENESGRRLRVAPGEPNGDWAGTLRRLR